MERISTTLKGTLEKSFLSDLRDYLSLHKEVQHFSIYSDYCINAASKFNNVASFTLAPSWTANPEMVELFAKKMPKDIKKTRAINGNIIEVLTNQSFFHITFILADTSGTLHASGHSEQELAINSMDSVIEMIQMWIQNQPEGKEKFEEQIKRFKSAKYELKKKTANLQLFRLVGIIALFAAYLAFLLSRESEIKTITWFSDRDKITESFNGICFVLFENNHYALCLGEMDESKTPRTGVGIDDSGESKLWFDSLIRIPDYLAGTIASWKLDEHFTPMKKHTDLLLGVFAENPFCTLIYANISKEKINFGRHTVSRLDQSSVGKSRQT
jgi:hypothetical protein